VIINLQQQLNAKRSLETSTTVFKCNCNVPRQTGTPLLLQ